MILRMMPASSCSTQALVRLAGAVTGDHQLGRVGTQFSGVCVHPLYGGPCIFHRSGEGVLGGQTVLREHHRGAGLLGDVPCICLPNR